MASCLNNQKQLVLGGKMYALDNGDGLLPPRWSPTNVVIELRGGGYWRDHNPDTGNSMPVAKALEAVRRGMEQGPLWKYVTAFNSYHCPGDLRPKRKVGQGWAWDSYSKAEGINGNGWVGVKPYTKESHADRPSETMMFVEESDPRGWNIGTWVIDVAGKGWTDPFAIFHGNVSDFGFLDGHAEQRKWVSPDVINAAKKAANGDRNIFNWPGGGRSNRSEQRKLIYEPCLGSTVVRNLNDMMEKPSPCGFGYHDEGEGKSNMHGQAHAEHAGDLVAVLESKFETDEPLSRSRHCVVQKREKDYQAADDIVDPKIGHSKGGQDHPRSVKGNQRRHTHAHIEHE